jgi:hypothetical protein
MSEISEDLPDINLPGQSMQFLINPELHTTQTLHKFLGWNGSKQ